MFKAPFIISGLLVGIITLSACSDKTVEEDTHIVNNEQQDVANNSENKVDVTSVAVYDPNSPEAKVDAEQQY